MSPLAYLRRRLLQSLPVLLIITVIVFLMIRLIPGDPASVMLGMRGTPETLARLRVQMGLDQPLPVQYLIFMRDLVTLNFGQSVFYKIPVTELIGRRLGVTLILVLYTCVITVLLTIPLALYSALNRNKIGDQVIRGISLAALTMPSFWLGILLLLVFSIRFRLFPVGGGLGSDLGGYLRGLFLPALTLSFGMIAPLLRSLRSSLIDVLQTDFVAFARAKGLPERKVLVGHVIRSGLIPTVTLLGVNLSFLIGGTVVVEKVFAIPGVGALMVDSIFARDYAVIQAMSLVFALLVMGINLATDFLYAFLDPRIKFG